MLIALGIVGYFLGMVLTLVCLKCADSELVNGHDEEFAIFPIMLWPVVVVMYVAYFAYKLTEKVANIVLALVCHK